MASNTTSSDTMSPVITTQNVSSDAPSETTQQVTQFVDDTGIQTASLPAPTEVTPDVLASGSEVRVHEIADILERPVVISGVEWPDTAAFDTLLPISPGTPGDLETLNFPQALFDASPNLADKINYFSYLRARLVVRIVVNSNPFQLGKLIAYFAPYSSFDDIGDRTLANSYMSARSAFPHIILDAGTGNSGELCIPFVSYYTHWNLPEQIGNLGNLQVAVLNPLKSGTCNFTIFARFTDVHLGVPTAVPTQLVAEASLSSALKRLSNLYGERRIRKRLRDIRAQVGEGTAKDSGGVISSILGTVSNLSSMATHLPLIGKYMAPISWVSGAASQIAQYAGLSKPINLTQQHRLTQLPAYGYTNADGSDTSLCLANSCENSIGVRTDVFGTSHDDMDIAYVAGHSCYLTTFTWSEGAIVGSIIGDVNVTPGVAKETTEQSIDSYDSTLLAYVSSMFRYWRGSIKFKIQAAKTAYHSGRLRISFIPLGGAGETQGYRMDQAYSEILDLRLSNEIEMNIDYLSNTIWKDVDLVNVNSNVSTRIVTGIIRIEVLNKLVRPTTVSPDVQLNIWIGGGSDIQFACPEFNRFFPVTPDAESALEFKRKPVAQVYDHMQNPGFDSALMDAPDMFSPRKCSQLDAEASCIGEHVQSLRQLTRRFGRIASAQPTEDNVFRVGSAWFGDLPARSNPQADLIGFPPMYYISWLYRFFRGSIRYKCVNLGDGDGIISADTSCAQDSVPIPPTFSSVSTASRNLEVTGGAAFSHFVDLRYNNVNEIVAPYYNNTHVSLLRGENAVATPAMEKQTHVHFSVPPGRFRVLAAAGDDFSFGWIVGPPRLRRRVASEALNADVDYGKTIDVDYDPPSASYESGTLRLSPASVAAGTYTLIGSEQTFSSVGYASSDIVDFNVDFAANIALTAVAGGYTTSNWNEPTAAANGEYNVISPFGQDFVVETDTGAQVGIPWTDCIIIVNSGVAQFSIRTSLSLDIPATEDLLAAQLVTPVKVVNQLTTPTTYQTTIPSSFTLDVVGGEATIPIELTAPSTTVFDIDATLANVQALGVISYALLA